MKLKDKVIVVTGSTRGIGRAIAEACAQEGGRVVICSRDEGAVKQASEELAQRGFQVSGRTVDVSLVSDLESLLQHALETWGRVDVWINNAGLSGGYRHLDEMSPQEIEAIVDVNLNGTLIACRIVIPHFIEQGGGILINISGKGGRGDASPFMATYAATKAAVTSLTKSLAQEYKDHPISIHSVVPGMVATDFYEEVKTGEGLSATTESLPYVLKALGVPLDEVGRFVAGIAAQQPARVTGKNYSVLRGFRLTRGIALLMWYRMTGKVRGTA
ncbi:MAG: SDR family NAD(P)-dependent oxidoreductase [Anaerolineae bacterium]|nr:SDR family NAD(P)-dependent oxidoreductase [Anaerolineae bacterium]NIN97825.1 SDR family NAD(P)-dependent oxidoreductase [Anaerolineae bacterium]NIQ80823.1 SDR family NAD(P)-dependent oxidoreductase [Anaerolineae bacterium]